MRSVSPFRRVRPNSDFAVRSAFYDRPELSIIPTDPLWQRRTPDIYRLMRNGASDFSVIENT